MDSLVSDLAENVRQAILEYEAFLDEWDLVVLESNGIITLRGKVPTPKHREAIEKVVLNQAGVHSVRNELDVDASLIEGNGEINLDIQVPPVNRKPFSNQ